MVSHPSLRSRTSSDLVSQLPEDIKHKILECLDTREAAKTALLSTQWNEVWLRHGRLVFSDEGLLGEGKGVRCSRMITNALFLRPRPVRKFTLDTSQWRPAMKQSDLDLWCRFLSKNGIEQLNLNIAAENDMGNMYKLPVCIIFCPTIKQLQLEYMDISLPVNIRQGSMFYGVTSLEFSCVDFYRDDSLTVIPRIPYLEVLVFWDCDGIDKFVIDAPRLKYLSFTYAQFVAEWKWFELHFRVIKTLRFGAFTFLYNTDATINIQERLPIATNLQVIELRFFRFADANCVNLVIQLLRKCPKLRELEMFILKHQSHLHGEADPTILRDMDSWFSDLDLGELRTVKMKSFDGSTQEMLFIKLILSKSPSLEEVLITESDRIDASVALKAPREMISYPRASPKAKVIFCDISRGCSIP
ncbi:unnamed protein product [Cuscuta epithymum]|uniref:F-box domain-containing protein n=1 Tax=Cuscuta epithymum TaxID=186058 RepID=A0AAV0CTG9_9ASTE|nr:unnamed protein product [Cuscuta epithymum]